MHRKGGLEPGCVSISRPPPSPRLTTTGVPGLRPGGVQGVVVVAVVIDGGEIWNSISLAVQVDSTGTVVLLVAIR